MTIGTRAYAGNKFSNPLSADLNPILSFDSKALPDSLIWAANQLPSTKLPKATEPAMLDRARSMSRRLGLRDSARFDFHVAADGELKLMEVNPHPAWADDGKLCFMAGFAGLESRDMLRLILEAAIARLARCVD